MEMFCSEKITELAGAMLKVQAGLEAAVKDAENPFAKSRAWIRKKKFCRFWPKG